MAAEDPIIGTMVHVLYSRRMEVGNVREVQRRKAKLSTWNTHTSPSSTRLPATCSSRAPWARMNTLSLFASPSPRLAPPTKPLDQPGMNLNPLTNPKTNPQTNPKTDPTTDRKPENNPSPNSTRGPT